MLPLEEPENRIRPLDIERERESTIEP